MGFRKAFAAATAITLTALSLFALMVWQFDTHPVTTGVVSGVVIVVFFITFITQVLK